MTTSQHNFFCIDQALSTEFDALKENLKGKKVVCKSISGNNNLPSFIGVNFARLGLEHLTVLVKGHSFTPEEEAEFLKGFDVIVTDEPFSITRVVK